MRAELGIVALTLGLWAAGAAVLLSAGIVSATRRSVLVWGGASYLVGVATVGMVLTVLSIAGVRVTTPLVGAVIAVAVVAGAALARLRRPTPLAPLEAPRDRRILWAAAAVAVVFAIVGTGLALVKPVVEWDGWAIWGVKAVLLYDRGSVPDELATGAYGLTHVDYPLFWPVFDATYHRVMGGPEIRLATLPYWLLYVAFAWTVAAVGSRITRPAIWAPIAAGTLTSYAILEQLYWHYADVPTGIMLGAAVLFAGLWLSGHGSRWLVPAAPLLAAAANGKNEGLAATGAVLVALAVAAILAWRRRAGRGLLALGAAATVVVVGVLPWRLWLASHEVEGDIKASRALDPDELSDRWDRVEPSASKLWDTLTDPGRYGYMAFVAIALIAIAVVRRPTRALGAFHALNGLLVFLALTLAYWVAETDLHWHLTTSGDRVVQVLAFVGIAAVLQLSAALYEEDT